MWQWNSSLVYNTKHFVLNYDTSWFGKSRRKTQPLQWRHNELDVRLKSQACWLFAQPFVQAQIKENIKAPRHWLSWGESSGDWWIPLTKGQ